MKIKELGEIGLIDRIAKKTKLDNSVIKGIGDDTAVVKWTKDKYLLLTCDMLVEDVHFRIKDASPRQIGWKALARNISDIAAMGGVPRYALVSVGISPDASAAFAEGIYKGMSDIAKRFNINIVGGDTVRSGKLVIDVSLAGEVEKNKVVYRSGAKDGDMILVTGSLGGSGKNKHLDFVPRVKEARELVKKFKINSMIDISDGLVLDLSRILKASNKGAMLYKEFIPVSKNAKSFESAITEGEDFELLFTMDRGSARKLLRSKKIAAGTPIHFIGEIVEKKYGYKMASGEGNMQNIAPKGYLHF